MFYSKVFYRRDENPLESMVVIGRCLTLIVSHIQESFIVPTTPAHLFKYPSASLANHMNTEANLSFSSVYIFNLEIVLMDEITYNDNRKLKTDCWKDASNIIFLNRDFEDYWIVSDTTCWSKPLSTRCNATSLLRTSVLIFSPILAAIFHINGQPAMPEAHA